MIFYDDAQRVAYTNLRASGTTITRASGVFSLTWLHIGTYLHITAGTNWIAGWYRIVSITSTSSFEVDRTPLSTPGSNNGTGHFENSQLVLYNHYQDVSLTDIQGVFNTTVASHPSATTINTNKKILLSLADLSSSSDGLTLTSATGGFTADMVNMKISITAGTGWTVCARTVKAFIDANNITIDRSAGASKTGGSGNIAYVIPNLGTLCITKASTGVTEYVPYSSYQNDGSGKVQFTVTAPVQTFASGDAIQLKEILFQELRVTNHYTMMHPLLIKTASADGAANDFGLAFSGNTRMEMLSARSIAFAVSGTSYRGSLKVGTMDSSGEFDVVPDHCGVIFNPTNSAYAGFGSAGFDTSGAGTTSTLVYGYSCYLKSNTAYLWQFNAPTGGTSFVGEYVTFHKFAGMSGKGAMNLKRANFTGGSGLFGAITNWMSSAYLQLSDIFLNGNLNALADGTYDPTDAFIVLKNVNIPTVVKGGSNYRGYLTNMGYGGVVQFAFTDCWPVITEAIPFAVYGTVGGTVYFFQSFTRYIRVIDVAGKPIVGANVTFKTTKSVTFPFTIAGTYTTDADGYANAAAPLVITVGNDTYPHAISFPWKAWRLDTNGISTPATVTEEVYDPYEVIVSKDGYDGSYDLVSLGVVDSHLKTEIIVKLRQSVSAGRDAMGSEFR